MSVKGHLGNYNTATTRTHVRFSFSTHAAAGGNVAPSSAFEAADLRIYKATDGAALSATQRSSASGITMTSPFDSLTGDHSVDIDLTDDTDAGFYATGCYYEVKLCPDETVDGQTVTSICLCSFEIGVPVVNAIQFSGNQAAADNAELYFGDGSVTGGFGNVLLTTTITSLTSQTVFRLSNGPTVDNTFIGALAVVTDGDTYTKAIAPISAYTGASKQVTLAFDPAVFTMANGDTISILAVQRIGTNSSGHVSRVTLTDTTTTNTDMITAAGIRTALGMSSANLDTQISTLATAAALDTVDNLIDTEIAAIQSTLASLFTTAITEPTYRTDGAAGSLAQLIYEINQTLGDRSISGTTCTVKKVDGVTTAFQQTLDSSSTPTSITHA